MLTVQKSRTEERWLCEIHVYHSDGNNEETEKQPRPTVSSLDHILNCHALRCAEGIELDSFIVKERPSYLERNACFNTAK